MVEQSDVGDDASAERRNTRDFIAFSGEILALSPRNGAVELEDGLKLMEKEKVIRQHPYRQSIFDFFREMFSVETWLKIKSTLENIYHHGPRKNAK
ncbi:hypothetical protein MMC30_003896 [Trapelia coarctata]|nr:hypothetical protein [Trapelia coarctata]